MYKSLKRIVLLLALVCVTLGLSAFALACNPKPDDNNNGKEISAEYQALYEQYKEAAGENAKTLQDWYDALTADIEEIGDIGDITDMDVLEIENVKYVALTFENGRLFLEELLNGESFKEYSVFTLSPNAAEQSTITGIYLDVNRKGTNGALEKVCSTRTGPDGKASVYLEVGQVTYVITVGAQSADSYGIALGYEPEFSGSQNTKTVTFGVQAASQKVTYTAKVVYRAENYAPTKDVKLSLRYVESDAASLKVVGEGKTDDDGKLAISFYPHEDSKYEFVLDETSLTPETYDPVEGPIEVDPEAEETVFTLIRLKNYNAPETLTPSGTPAQANDFEDKDWVAATIPTSGELTALLTYNSELDTYTYKNESNKQVYVALDFFLERVHPEKTIKQLLDEGGFFTYEVCVDPDQNTWVVHDYSQVLKAYMKFKSERGVYPLNKDLYDFVTAAAANGLFKGEADEIGTYDLFKPLVVESVTKLIVGKPYETTLKAGDNEYYFQSTNNTLPRTSIPLMNDMEEGWYKLNVKSDTFKNTNKDTKSKFARLGGYTRDKNGLFNFGRYFTLQMKSPSGTTSNVEFEGVIYVGAGDKEIVMVSGADGFFTTYNLTLNLSNITAEDGNVVNAAGENVDLSALAGKKQQLLSPDKGEYEVLVYPENSIWEQHTDAADADEKKYLKYYTNIPTFGYTFDMNNQCVKYTITPTAEGINDLKIHDYSFSYTESSKQEGQTTGYYVKVGFTYTNTAGTAFDGETPIEVQAGVIASNLVYGVLFTHSGTGIKTMKIKLEATKTQYTVTYSAGEGVGEDYTVGSGSSYYNLYTYYAKDADITTLDNSNVKLGYTREGYLFDGWSYENGEGETVKVVAGAKIKMPEHDLVLTAVWRAVNVNSKDLAVGGNVEVEFDSGTYTSAEINLTDTVVENKGYTLTITMGEDEWNSDLKLVLGDYIISPIEAETSETSHKYVAYFVKLGGADKIVVDLSKLSDINLTATFALAEYTPVVLKADGVTEFIVPVYDFNLVSPSNVTAEDVKTNVLYATLDGSMTVPATYLFIKDGNALPGTVSILLKGDSDDSAGGVKYSPASRRLDNYAEPRVELSEGVSKIHFYAIMFTDKYFGAIKFRIENLYTVTYTSTQDDVDTKDAPENPSEDATLYKGGENVTLKTPDDIGDAYAFEYWTMEGDDSATHYEGGSQYEIHKNTTFVAHWLQLNKMKVHVDFNRGDSGTGDEELKIDPDTNTHCEIVLENLTNISNGVIVTLDLGTSDFSKEIPMKIDTTDVVFTHSEALSSDGHKVYSAAYKTSGMVGVDFTLSLDLSAWKAAGNPVLSDIGVAASKRHNVGKNGSYTVYGVYFEKKADGKLWANGSLNPSTSAAGEDFGYALPDTMLGGHTYKVHAKFHVDDPKTTVGNSITLKVEGDSKYTMQYDANAKEYTYDGWDSSKDRFFMLEDSSIKNGLTCDVWLEQTDVVEHTLSLEKEVASVVVKKDTPAKVYLDESIPATVNKNNAKTKYVLALTDATAEITLKYYDDISNYNLQTVKLNADNHYSARGITFGNGLLTLSNATDTEQTVTVKLSEFKPQDITYDGANEYSLGANQEILDLNSKLSGYGDIAVTKKDGGALDDGTVIKFKNGSTTYTFNKENNFALKELSLVTNPSELWSENGAVEIKISCKRVPTISSTGEYQPSSSFGFAQNGESVEILKRGTGIKNDTNYVIHIKLSESSTKDYVFEVTVGDTTFDVNGNGTTHLIADQTIQFTEENSVIKITAKAGITAPISGISIYLVEKK